MRTKKAARLGGAPRSGRWGRKVTGRPEQENRRAGLVALLAGAVFLLAIVAGFGVALDRTLRGGLLAQHSLAAERPDWVPLLSLPDYVALAFLIVVDPNFFQRGLFDPGADGATVSRDLVRQVHLLPDDLRGWARTTVMAPVVELRLSDAELLELYLNRVQLGADDGWPIFGVHHAAREYFGKDPRELTLGEAATLAGLLLPPRITEPNRHVGAAGIRRNEVLLLMVRAGVIDEAAHLEALNEPLGFQPGPEFAPMTRPPGWDREPEVIRLPDEELSPPAAEAAVP